MPTLSGMISKLTNSLDVSNIYLFNIHSKIYVAKDDIPVDD